MMQRSSRSLASAILLLACTAAGPGMVRAADSSSPQESSAQQTAALRQAIERDQQRLKELVSSPSSAEPAPLRENPELREIGVRLPALQRRLRQLEKGRAAGPVPPATQ